MLTTITRDEGCEGASTTVMPFVHRLCPLSFVVPLAFVIGCGARREAPPPTSPTTATATPRAATLATPGAASAPRQYRGSALEGGVTFTVTAVRPPRVQTTNGERGNPRTRLDVELAAGQEVSCDLYASPLRPAYVALQHLRSNFDDEDEAVVVKGIDVSVIAGGPVLWATANEKSFAAASRVQSSVACWAPQSLPSERFRAFFEEMLTHLEHDPPPSVVARQASVHRVSIGGSVVGYVDVLDYDSTDGTTLTVVELHFFTTREKNTVAVDNVEATTVNARGDVTRFTREASRSGVVFEDFALEHGKRGYTIRDNSAFGRSFESKLATKGMLFGTDTLPWRALLQKVRAGKTREARFSTFDGTYRTVLPVVVKRLPSGDLSYTRDGRELKITLDDDGLLRISKDEFSIERIFVRGGK
jgi:hypothetical protein